MAYGSETSLYACMECKLVFKSPAPPASRLEEFYAQVPHEGLWEHATPPPAWALLARALESCKGGRVLDVGCFRGDLAHWLGDDWRHFGVEPNRGARKVASARGVEILGDALESLADDGEQFDAVLLCDVVEHMPNPFSVVQMAWRQTKPGGRLLVVTGSPDARTWRLARSRYWYTVFPEHLAFCGEGWFRWAAHRLGAECRVLGRVATVAATPWLRAKESLRNIQYLLSRRREDWVIWWTTSADHIVVELRRSDHSALDLAG